ncbi:MAG: hypothetical protein JSS81_23340 [Acidobacteria bacterium]|nr:hypothetical protein [Acidobacteriota bacterium]
MTLEEDEIYIGSKIILQKNGWELLAGQPPNGCDHIPVVEIKSATNTEKGSKLSYKPDLIAHKFGIFLLVECKPVYCETDALKLRDILTDPSRKLMLFNELEQRKIFLRHKIVTNLDTFVSGLNGALAYSGIDYFQKDLFTIKVSNIYGDGSIIQPSR